MSIDATGTSDFHEPFSAVSPKTGKRYYLHGRLINLIRGHGSFPLYWFSSKIGKDALRGIPEGYEIATTKGGCLCLRKLKNENPVSPSYQ